MTEMRFAKSEFEGRYLYIWLRPVSYTHLTLPTN